MQNKPASDYFRISKDINYVKLFKIILSRWYWIVAMLLIGLTVGQFYIWYEHPLYITTASIKLEEKNSELSELMNIRNIYDRTDKTESETYILKSRNVLLKAIKSLNYEISYFQNEKFLIKDLYPQKPLNVEILRKGTLQISEPEFEFQAVSSKKFLLRYTTIDNQELSKEYSYGQTIYTPYLEFKIHPPKIQNLKGVHYIFRLNNLFKLLQRVNNALYINETQNINIINLKITDQNPYFTADILNAILDQYLNFNRSQRSLSIIQSEIFINSLLQRMSDKVKNSGKAIQKFKENHQLLNISSNLNNITDHLINLEAEKHTLDIENVQIVNLKKNLIKSLADENDLNYGMQGVADPQLNNLLSKYNELIIKKKQTSNYYTKISPDILRLDDQIKSFITAIDKNIVSQLTNNNKTRKLLNYQRDSIRQSLNKLPRTEREFISLQSSFDVDQKIYNYLSEKKLEAQISKAAVIPGAIIIDRPTIPFEAISPIPKNIYGSSVIVSLVLGVALIFTMRLSNPYIYNREIIEEHTKTPIIGLIGKYPKKNLHKIPVLDNPRSLFSESVRAVRSNISFLASENDSKVIFITSEISGEGKSFISLNLAASLTLIEKKVVLIATDLRKSKLHQNLNISNRDGLSQYLSGQRVLNDILKETHVKNLDFIPSGPIPPNPSELIHSSRMQGLIGVLKTRYDLIILDSAPIGLVTDGKPLLKTADINLFILRSGVSRHCFIDSADILQKELGLSNFGIILNDFEQDQFHDNYYNFKKIDSNYYPKYQSQYNYNKEYFEL